MADVVELPARDEITLQRGADESLIWTYQVQDGDAEPVGEDLTEWTARMEIRDTRGVLLARFHSTITGPGVDGPIELTNDGQVQIAVHADMSAAWPWWVGAFGVELVRPTGQVVPFVVGTIVLRGEVVTGE